MAIDLKRTWGTVLEKPVATGYTISTEGTLLIRSALTGTESVMPATGLGSETVLGFAMNNYEQPATAPMIETVTADATAYTAQLSHTSLPFSTIVGETTLVECRVYDVTLGAEISTQIAHAGSPGNTNEWKVDPDTGIVTVHSARASHVLTVYYRYNLTVLESQQLYFQPHVNNTAVNALGMVGVYCGKGQIFTYEYDMNCDYSSFPALETHVGGRITGNSAGGGTAITNMRVIKAPTASDLALGIEFNI